MASAQFDVMGGRLSHDDMARKIYNPASDSYEVRVGYYGGLVNQSGSLANWQQNQVQQGMGSLQGYSSLFGSRGYELNYQNYDPFQNTYQHTYKPIQPTKKEGIMKLFRDYLNTHRDLIFTVALVFIADHYLLNGALKERIQRLLEGILNKAESTLHREIAK